MQKAWQDGFKNLTYAMRTLAILYEMAPDSEVEVNCTWGDGILEDTDMEYQRRWSMVVSNKLKPELFLAWYFGCSEEEAAAMMPAQQRMFPQEE